MRAWLCVALVAAACGGGTGTSGDDDGQPDAGSDASPDADLGPGWTKLIERGWDLEPNVEQFKCRRIQITQDMYISGFRALSPTGTHHELLSMSTGPATPIGDYDCSSSADLKLLFGGGIDSNDFELPPGVAIKIPAGSYINLNLHLLNISDDPLSGTSGVYVKTLAPSEVVHEADMMFLGTYDLHIPATDPPTMTMIPGSCVTPEDWTIVNLWPHMHSYGVHQKVSVRHSGGSMETLLDTDYSYTEQKNYPMPSMVVRASEELRVECTYLNDTAVTYPPNGYEIVYGEGALEEMCFAGFYKYPAGGNAYDCAAM